MRFIDNSKLEPEDTWLKKADKALEEARRIPNKKKRSEFIGKRSNIWKELKPDLEALSNRKCWYCESEEKRSDRNVDHYRPKNSVKGTDHGGYWWKTFRPDNFRLSCTFCNSLRGDRETGETGGKGDYFPLSDESTRVCEEKDDKKCKHEDALLLDPCKRSDVELLWFGDDGRAVPRYSEGENPHAFKKADISIKHYHLNEIEIKEARQGLRNTIKGLVEDGDFYFEDCLTGEPNAEKGISKIMQALDEMLEPGAEFSTFARTMLSGFRKRGREWLERI